MVVFFRRKNMAERANPIDVEQYIQKAHFPASKTELIQFAQGHNAPNQILSALQSIPDRKYNAASDAARETFYTDEDMPRGLDSCDD
jgi:hypothetical protein